MASKPGILTDWPWTFLGNFKYVVLAPWAMHSTYSYLFKDDKERYFSAFITLPLMLWRMLHSQMWISYSRYRTAKGTNRILDRTIEFDQVDRERHWDDQIIFNGVVMYLAIFFIEYARRIPWWNTEGVIWMILLHAGPVEFIYYWLHRALHHHFLYSRYHSHHHSSIVTEPITSVVHPFAEHISYFMLFGIPTFTSLYMKNGSLIGVAGYITYIDFMNNMGHCNFEHIPKWVFSVFPPLKYIMYTPSYHSLHHTQFRTNYSLFMPIYDYLYGTMDKTTDSLYETSLVRKADEPDVVHLTHLTTPESIYHLRLGFACLASQPHESKWYLWFMWPVTAWSVVVAWIYGRTFTVERNGFKGLKLQTWAVPKYSVQYSMQWHRDAINEMIEDSILEAEHKGTKVLSLGLLNQAEGLNQHGELFLTRRPKLKVKLVDGSSLAVAIVLDSIPKGTSRVVLRGNHPSKVAYSISLALCQRGVQVHILSHDEYKKHKAKLSEEDGNNLVFSQHNAPKTWLVGDGLTKEEQLKAPKGALFIPFSSFPPKKTRSDCDYNSTPAMLAPEHLENIDSCENWLPRRVMSASRIAGIVHAMEGWNAHESGDAMFDIEKIWQASLKHGFRPLTDSKQK